MKWFSPACEFLINLSFCWAFFYVGAFAGATSDPVTSRALAFGMDGAYFFFGLSVVIGCVKMLFEWIYGTYTE